MDDAAHFFVYGTLKRGECRERMWPHPPQNVQRAYVRGCLYDLGPYPAMIAGDDWVAGEIWTVAEKDVLRTIEVLDEIEDYHPAGDNNLYTRVQVPWFSNPEASSDPQPALTYHYARTQRLMSHQRIEPHDGGPVYWSTA